MRALFIYFKNALWLQRGTLGAFDSDPPAECLPAAPLSRAPSLSAQWVLASGPAASDLTRLCAWAPLGHPGCGSWGPAGMSWAKPGPLWPCEGPLSLVVLQFDQALLGPELASDTQQTKGLFERPGSEQLGFIRPGFCGTIRGPKSLEPWAFPDLGYYSITDTITGWRRLSFCISLLSSELPPVPLPASHPRDPSWVSPPKRDRGMSPSSDRTHYVSDKTHWSIFHGYRLSEAS